MKGVFLVGAGPGDKDLITVKGAKLLEHADVIVYDQLANPSLLEYAKSSCELIYVGKKAGNHTMKQSDINQLLIDMSYKYTCVVRLKGGDPYVFGRGSEEGAELFNHQIPFEVIPGITSAIGGLTYAGIPITSRGLATSFHVMTGHLSKDSIGIDYSQLAKMNGTLVFLMGVANLGNIVDGLIKYGKNPCASVAIIHKGTLPNQKVILGDLNTIVEISLREKIKPPSLIVIGDVVKLREQLNFYEKKPLFGKSVLVTRSREKQSKMSERLIELGALVTQLPAIRTREINFDEMKEAILRIKEYDGIVFTSGVAVEIFAKAMRVLNIDGRAIGNCKLLVIGNETKKVLESINLYPDLLPDSFTKEGLTKMIIDSFDKESSFLVPRSAKGDVEWIINMSKSYRIHEIHCYDTELVDDIIVEEDVLLSQDYITFTSSSTVHGFMNQLSKLDVGVSNEIISNAKIVAIGPTTKETLINYNIKVDLMPDTYNIASMIEVILKDNT